MGPEMSGQVALSYMRYLGESNFAGIVYTHSSGESAAWAAGIQYFGYGSMKETDASGMPLFFDKKSIRLKGHCPYANMDISIFMEAGNVYRNR